MPLIQELEPLIQEPREDLGSEYKMWLDLSINEHKALLAKAAIAIVNHGGGFITLGFEDLDSGLHSRPRPENLPEITQDLVNSAIRRFASPEFHCEVYSVAHPNSGVVHIVLVIPGTMTVPVMSKRDCDHVIAKNKCYIRKPGPRSEEPHTGEEWRSLLNRCIRSGRDDLLGAIRSIVTGRVDPPTVQPNLLETLRSFSLNSRERWIQLIDALPGDAPSRFPHGYYEMSFKLLNAQAVGLAVLQDRLQHAQQIKLTGWTPFLNMPRPEWRPYPFNSQIEAWVGRPVDGITAPEPKHADFWRVSTEAELYTIRGYAEDSLSKVSPGKLIDVTLPIWRVAEALLFARRFAEKFDEAESIQMLVRFTGLSGRVLTSVTGQRDVVAGGICHTPEVIVSLRATLQQVDDNLAELMHRLLSPLYESFSFYRLPMVLVEQELDRMIKNRF